MAKKTFNQVKLNVAFTTATTRANIANNENISIISGKIAKWYSDFHSCVWNGNAAKVNGKTVGVDVPANAKFTDTTYTNMTAATASAAGKSGLVPAPAAGAQNKFLRGDGTWVVPTNTTYSVFVKSGTEAKSGLVPAPSTTAGTTKYLREDGTWSVPPNTNTDIFVKQSPSVTEDFRPIVLGKNRSTDASELDTEITDQTYISNLAYIKPSTGGIYTKGNFYTSLGIYASNGSSNNSGYTTLIGHNNENLWIGAITTTGPHHYGRTYISSGYDNTNNEGYDSIKIVVPNNTNDNGTSYDVLHTGNTHHVINSSDDLWSSIGVPLTKGYVLKVLHSTTSAKTPSWFAGEFSSGIVFGSDDTKGVISINYNTPKFTIVGGSHNDTKTNPKWYLSLTGTSEKTYNLDNFSTTSHTHNYLPLNGGTITGSIKYKTTSRTSDLFLVDNGDANGSMYSGPHTGGLTIIGSGLSANSLRTTVLSDDGLEIPASSSSKFSTTSKSLILSADSSLYIMTGCSTMANRKAVVISSSGNLYPGVNETCSVGASTYKWNAMYANTFYGALNGNASTASKWNTSRNINGLSIDGSADRINYGTCSTAASTVAKTVSCTGFALATGAEITVKFTVTNTASNPTLNVNSTGAKAIYYRGSAITASYLAANRTYTFRYNGTQYDLVGDVNTNTDTKVTVTGIKTNATLNSGIKRPLLFAAATANPNNELSTATDDVPNGCKATTYTGGVSMNGGIYIETNYWTTGASGSYVKLHLPNGGFVVGNLTGNVSGTATYAEHLKQPVNINSVSFAGDSDISITKCLYSGSGATTVTLTDSQSNYDLLIIVTSVGTLVHRVGTGYAMHTFCTYPVPSQNGTKTVDLCNVSTNISVDKKITTSVSSVKLTGSGTTASAVSSTQVVNITEVYGLKLS